MTVAEQQMKRVEITAEAMTLVIGLTAAAAAISTLFPGMLTSIQQLPLFVPSLVTAVQVLAMILAALARRSDLVKGGFAVILVLWVRDARCADHPVAGHAR